MKSKTEIKELREKIIKGIELAIERLIESSKEKDESLVVVQDGKVMKVKARELA